MFTALASLFSNTPVRSDVADIPEEAKERIQFVPVETVDEVLKTALGQPPSPYEG